MNIREKALAILVEELENSDIRKYTCVNASKGNTLIYSQLERNIVDRILALIKESIVEALESDTTIEW